MAAWKRESTCQRKGSFLKRFVRLQIDDLLDFPAYDGEEWIRIQKYNGMSWDILIPLWYNYNCLLLNVIENADDATLQNVWVENEDTIPLEQLIYDYYKHLELHIEHFNNRQKEAYG